MLAAALPAAPDSPAATRHHRRLHARSPSPLVVQGAQISDIHIRSQNVIDHVDDPSIFDRMLTAEAEELERRTLAETEEWYNDPFAEEREAAEAAVMGTVPGGSKGPQDQISEAEAKQYELLGVHVSEWARYIPVEGSAGHGPNGLTEKPPTTSEHFWDDSDELAAYDPLSTESVRSGGVKTGDGETKPHSVQHFAHQNAVGGHGDDEQGNDSEDGAEEDDLGDDDDNYEMEALWDENDPYFAAEDGSDQEGDFYRSKRAVAARAKKSKGRQPKSKSKTHKAKVGKPVRRSKGLVGYSDKRAGPSGATTKTTKRSGPNGSQAWLNNGISKSRKSGKWVGRFSSHTDRPLC